MRVEDSGFRADTNCENVAMPDAFSARLVTPCSATSLCSPPPTATSSSHTNAPAEMVKSHSLAAGWSNFMSWTVVAGARKGEEALRMVVSAGPRPT